MSREDLIHDDSESEKIGTDSLQNALKSDSFEQRIKKARKIKDLDHSFLIKGPDRTNNVKYGSISELVINNEVLSFVGYVMVNQREFAVRRQIWAAAVLRTKDGLVIPTVEDLEGLHWLDNRNLISNQTALLVGQLSSENSIDFVIAREDKNSMRRAEDPKTLHKSLLKCRNQEEIVERMRKSGYRAKYYSIPPQFASFSPEQATNIGRMLF